MSEREPAPMSANPPSDGDLRRSDVMCRAEDLRTFLEVLANQITDADKRHSEALRDLHSRLEHLGGQTSSLKASLPRPFASAFEQIEEGMAQLAARLTDGERERAARRSDRPSESDADEPTPQVLSRRDVETIISETLAAMTHGHPSAHVAPAASPAKGPVNHDKNQSFTEADASQAPPALRSAVPAGSTSSWSRTAPVAEAAAAPEPVPVARPHAGEFVQNPDEPWDDTSAAALSRLYDTEDPGIPPLRSAIVEGVRAPQVLTGHRLPADASPEAPVGFDPSAPVNFDPAWFDSRFADITRRVESSLAALTPEVMTAGLTRRFDRFEQRFDQALEGLASHSDVDGLRLVEAQIQELTQQVETATTYLSRLDTIEAHISDMRHQLSDDEIVRVFGGIVPTEDDLTRFAETAAESAAERVSKRVLANLPQADMSKASAPIIQENPAHLEKIASLHSMLSGFVEEQRRGDASTTQALDTLHEAMRVVLDRMEAIEAAQKQVPAAHLAETASAPIARADAMADDRDPTVASSHHDDELDEYKPPRAQRGMSALADDGDEEAKTPAERAKAAARAAAAARRDHGPRRESQESLSRGVEPDFDAPPSRSAGRAAAGAAPAAGDRQAFISLARKAAEKAKTGADVDAEEQPEGAADKSLRKRFNMPSVSLGGGAQSGVRPGVWIAASAMFLLLAGYWFMASPRTRVAMPVEVQRGTSAPAVTAPAQPNLKIEEEPESETSPAPAQPGNTESDPFQPAPAKPKVGSLSPETRGAMDVPAERSQQLLRPAAAPAVATSPGSLGIAIQQSSRQPSPDDVMRVRQKLHLANLSERTAQIAAQTSAVPAALAPADMREHATAADPASTAAVTASAATAPAQRPNIELPPALIGPLSLRVAAAKGDPSAQFDVAARFAEGKGVPQDFAQAALWYQRAASQGLAPAQYRLATLYERGIGVTADPARARQWYKRAAESGNLKAMHNLAVMTAARDQGSPDYATAAKLFTDAAERGLADSQYNLAVLLESGLGVERNPIAAYRWYSLAARAGDGESARRRELLKAKLDPQAMAQADAALAEWRPQLSDRASNDPRVAGEAWKARAANTAQ